VKRFRGLAITLLLTAAAGAVLADVAQHTPVAANSLPHPAQLSPADNDYGQLLYENHCRHCHDSQAYIRAARKVRSRQDIAHWVQHWATTLRLDWAREQRQAVADYLNREFYHFKVEGSPPP
jgi:cytochrome c5